MKLQHKKLIALLGLGLMTFTSLLQADEPIQKTLAIHYEDGKTSEALFQQSLGYFQKLIEPGYLISVAPGTAKIFGNVLDIQTPTDSINKAKIEREMVLDHVHDLIEASNIQYTGKFTILSTNLLFGDKSLGFVPNPYNGCYSHVALINGLDKAGYKVVKESENPDILMTIGIDVCMTENEMKAYIKKNTALSVIQSDSKSATVLDTKAGTDLMRAGSGMQLGTPKGGGNAGMAVAGIGLAVNMIGWMVSDDAPKERDVVRYQVKLESKGKTPITFYPIGFTKDMHDSTKPISLNAHMEAEKSLFLTFLAWDKENQNLEELLPAAFLEKNFVKSVEMMVASKK